MADGVIGFLSEAQNKRLFTSITDHFDSGVFAFNAYTRIVVRIGARGVLRTVGLPKGPLGFGFDDPRDIERLHPAFTLIDEQFGAQEQVEKMPWFTCQLAALFARWPAQARRGAWVVRYRF